MADDEAGPFAAGRGTARLRRRGGGQREIDAASRGDAPGAAAHGDLLAASSVCNAHTGFDDPYLPFSQLLSMLLGNLDDPNAALVDPVNAARLRAFFPTADEILTEQGPDLIDVLVPGGLLAATAARELPARSEWLNTLEAISAGVGTRRPPGRWIRRSCSRQYTDVLVQLSRQRPLLLVIDDMQWADNASVALFGRLVRHLQGQRIFLVGAYPLRRGRSAAWRWRTRHLEQCDQHMAQPACRR